MSGWIREQDVTLAFEQSRKEASSSRNAFRKGTLAGKNVRSESKGRQTTLKSHFGSMNSAEGSGTSKKSNAGGKYSALRDIFNGNIKDSGESNERPAKKRRGQDRASDEAQPITAEIRAHRLFGIAPNASLTPQALTPRRKQKTSSVPPQKAPAISPSKRRSLIIDTGKDVAMQQHRCNSRSSSPLQPIDVQVTTSKEVVRKTRSNSTTLTPSKLRHGYSLLAFEGHHAFPDISSESLLEENEDEPRAEQENSPSPSAERKDRVNSALRLAYTRSPTSNKRIYAPETLQTPQSPLDKFNEMRERELKEICERYGSGKGADEDGDKSSQETLLLSSPPPSSPTERNEILRQANDLSSSQTAPGGSFSLVRDHHMLDLDDGIDEESARDVMEMLPETYMSEEETVDEDMRRGCGDETFRLPSSQDLETPLRTYSMIRTLRSSTKRKERPVDSEPNEFEGGEETQPLAWSPSEKQLQNRGEAPTTGMRDRVSESWNNLGKVWSDVEIPRQKSQVPIDRAQQSNLHKFGFSGNGVSRAQVGELSETDDDQEASRLTRDVVFASDEEIDSDEEGEEEERDDPDTANTQQLIWIDEADETEEGADVQENDKDNQVESQSESQLMMMMLPDMNDLDTQGREWFNRL